MERWKKLTAEMEEVADALDAGVGPLSDEEALALYLLETAARHLEETAEIRLLPWSP